MITKEKPNEIYMVLANMHNYGQFKEEFIFEKVVEKFDEDINYKNKKKEIKKYINKIKKENKYE